MLEVLEVAVNKLPVSLKSTFADAEVMKRFGEAGIQALSGRRGDFVELVKKDRVIWYPLDQVAEFFARLKCINPDLDASSSIGAP